jgi:hypothetical protein
MVRLRLLIAYLTFFIVAVPVDARTYHQIGQGNSSCGSWTAWRRDGLSVAPGQWVLGFLSGVGFDSGGDDNPLQGMDADGVWAWIDSYCAAHPIDHIAAAAAAFYYAHPR